MRTNRWSRNEEVTKKLSLEQRHDLYNTPSIDGTLKRYCLAFKGPVETSIAIDALLLPKYCSRQTICDIFFSLMHMMKTTLQLHGGKSVGSYQNEICNWQSSYVLKTKLN